MNWESWSEFIRMGGYGPYVWGSLAVMAAAMAVEVWEIAARSRSLRRSGAAIDEGEVCDEGEN